MSGVERIDIPRKAIYRLSIYQRCLERLENNGLATVSSSALATAAGVKPAQLRRDLTYIGQFGTRGLGYPVETLRASIREVLGRQKFLPVILVGAGNLGAALLRYDGFQKEGFEVIAAFDAKPEVAKERGVPVDVLCIEEMPDFVATHDVKMAILCVPAEQAQKAVNDLVAAGITGVLNFSPTVLQVPDHVVANSVDLALELENLSYFIGK